ncbi:MAG: hypothetical protein ACREFU_07430 [Acetobacteraceae bacterium]
MKLFSHVTIAGAPEFRLSARIAPLAFSASGEATLEIGTGPIHAEIGEIPMTMRIPFLPPHRRVVAGSIGPFRIGVKPASATIRAAGARLEGKLGCPDAGCTLEGNANGKLEIDFSGDIPGKILKAAIEGAFEE